ncbi:MAG: carboxypeptidase-like regulatory domain-containing protein, partial [Myxococcota bacterium]
DLGVRGIIHASTTAPAAGATVTLEDRAWDPGVLATATTDADGRFSMSVVGLTSVDGCWATLLDYWIVAEKGTDRGERGVNSELYAAIIDGTLQADLSSFPIEMEDTAR